MTWRMMIPCCGRHASRMTDPFVSLQRHMNRAFEDALSGLPESVATTHLALDVKEDEKALHVTAELPGMSEKNVEIAFHDGILTIRGEKKIERDEQQDTWHIIERSEGSFSRQISMPAPIDADHIEARVEKGILRVTLPKLPQEEAKTKKIEVKGH
ncbi:MAG: Hsp20/alpha crystallin family protein [Alphaproteobacteria bacterium]|nr:Hsp20/alpha crystallin family protein [Alphaproteobacteria bacterium]